jgi:hypothetical protein
MMKSLPRSIAVSVVLAAASILIVASPAAAFNLRAPQVPFNFLPLQNYLNLVDPGINVATQQIDAQVWSVSVTGNTDFTLMLKTGLGVGSAVGLYNAGLPGPLFQVFPGGAVPGWYAALHFGGGNLIVSLFDQNSVFMGQTFYPGVNPNNFGFYIMGPGGLWFSQDALNGGAPQLLAYNSPWLPGDFWLCFEELPYNPQSTFDGVVLNVQSIRPTPAGNTTWGRVKGQYR